MKIRQTEHGNMCEVKLKDRRIRVLRLKDRTWAVSFVRPTKACTDCDDELPVTHKTYSGCRGRTMMTGIRLSRDAMTAFCNAVATLVEFEQNGVEVR